MSTMTETPTPEMDLSTVVIRTFEPKHPNEPATDGQKSLMERFELRISKGMTQGQANKRIHAYFVANPGIYLRYEAEKTERRKAAFEAKVKEYHALALSRSRQEARVPATVPQIRAVMVAAFMRKDVPEHLATEGRQLLEYGVLAVMASMFLNTLPRRVEDADDTLPN